MAGLKNRIFPFVGRLWLLHSPIKVFQKLRRVGLSDFIIVLNESQRLIYVDYTVPNPYRPGYCKQFVSEPLNIVQRIDNDQILIIKNFVGR
jgi:hypothetical protein